MAVKSKIEILEAINQIIGDSSDDASLSIIEDITDTYDDMQSRIDTNGDWKTKYEENDADWRKKYKERFMSGGSDDDDFIEEQPPEPKRFRFEDLFESK